MLLAHTAQSTCQTQSLALGQIQALQLLAMPRAELVAHLQQLAIENPLIEWDDTALDDDQEQDLAPSPATPNYWDDGAYPTSRVGVEDEHPDEPSWRPSFTDTLLQELRLSLIPSRIRELAMQLISELDGSGMIRDSNQRLAKRYRATRDEIEKAIAAIQSLGPPGIGARTLEERLWIQWKRRFSPDPTLDAVAKTLIFKYLRKMPSMGFETLKRRVNAPPGVFETVMGRLRQLSPVIGDDRDETPPPVLPDVVVQCLNGGPVVSVVRCSKHVRLNTYYVDLLNSASTGEVEKAYLRECLREARLLQRNLAHRELTIERVALAVFEHQEQFLSNGPAALKPLTQEMVAERLQLHPATVSRALANKQVQTRWGVFPFEYFFPNGLHRDAPGRRAVSSAWIKEWLKKAIASEDPASPRTDESLATELHRMGVQITRRTIANYRAEVGIPPANVRALVARTRDPSLSRSQ